MIHDTAQTPMPLAIWWIRRDLRLFDNPALHQALAHGRGLIPLFILDETLHQSPYMSDKRFAFLYEGLRVLEQALQKRGGQLIVRRGQPLAVLRQLRHDVGSEVHLFAQEDFSPYARDRDTAVGQEFSLTLTGGTTIRPPEAVRKNDGDPYVVFTPYKKKWLAQTLPRATNLHDAPEKITLPAQLDLTSDPIPTTPALPDTVPFPAGEAEGRRRLHQFVQTGIFTYGQKRDFMALVGTSSLSPYLRLGMVSAREAAVLALQAKAGNKTEHGRVGADTWLSELIWREFYVQILANFPQVRGQNFYDQYDHIPWRNQPDEFEAWCAGQTGYPIVDAAMRQLNTTGWMHNRARMLVASFLVKDLLIDWRWGEKYFMQQLIDGDPAANNGGWQWAAGTGTDAAPYFRIFNPIAQSKKFDPQGDYIRRWVPELRDVPDAFIHEPGQMSAVAQQKANCVVGHGRDYPPPIVNHQEARQRTLEAYKLSREHAQNS